MSDAVAENEGSIGIQLATCGDSRCRGYGIYSAAAGS